MSAALLASEIPANVTGWWVSEKLDGVRAIWTGTALLTRNGKRLNAPKWFTDSMPDIRLDGELWMGRGTFDKLVSTIQRKTDTHLRAPPAPLEPGAPPPCPRSPAP